MHGLYLLWWVEEKHVPAAIVAALLAAGDLAITALEIPTGWLADRYGHRASLIAGSLAQVAGMIWCWLGEGTFGLLAAVLLVAVGDAFRSGADQALLYRSCVALDREAEFQSIEARSHGLQLVALVVMVLAGGAIVETWGFAIGWLVEALVCAVGLAIACTMIEPPASPAIADANDCPTTRATSSARLLPLVQLIAPSAVLIAIASGASFLAQTRGGTEPGAMTVLVAIITLAEAAGAAVAARLPATLRSQVMLAGVGAVVLAAGWALPSAFVPAVVALSFLMGVAEPLRAAAIQRLAADEVRARAASVASACDRACTTVALIVAGTRPRRR